MNKEIKYNLTITEDDKEIYSGAISYEAMSSIISNSPDLKYFENLYLAAARSTSSVVRENVAYKENLNKETVELLIKDDSISVLRSLVRNKAFKKYAAHEDVERLFLLDAEIAKDIAGDYVSFENADSDKLIKVILASNDPGVLYALISGYNTPKKILRELSEYFDPYVSSEAKTRLENS
jgi:hypothetical protein